jgi:hypothetical protein
MAFNKAPTELWPSYTSDGTNITIPIAAIDGLTAAEAHTTTGDWRSIMLSLVSTAHRHYDELATADKPLAFVVTDPTVQSVTSGSFAGSYRTTYTFTLMTTFATPDMADEPA